MSKKVLRTIVYVIAVIIILADIFMRDKLDKYDIFHSLSLFVYCLIGIIIIIIELLVWKEKKRGY